MCLRIPKLVCCVIHCVNCHAGKLAKQLHDWGIQQYLGEFRGGMTARNSFALQVMDMRLQIADVGRKESTTKQYRGTIKSYQRWANELRMPGLPATPQMIELFLLGKRVGIIDSGRGAQAVAVGTLASMVAALAAWHQAFSMVVGVKCEPTAGPGVQALLQGQKRKFGIRHSQKIGVSEEAMQRALADRSTVFRLHRALVAATLYLGCLRVSAANRLVYSANPAVSDVLLPEVSGMAGVTVLRVRADKTQAAGEATERWVMDGVAPGNLVYSQLVRDFRSEVGFVEQGQFLTLPPTEEGRRRTMCTSHFVQFTAKRIAELGGDSADSVSSHSFRRGGASFYFGRTGSLEQVRDIGLWKSDAVLGYAQDRRARVLASLTAIRRQTHPQATVPRPLQLHPDDQPVASRSTPTPQQPTQAGGGGGRARR
jgi:hypothetical protein